MVERVRRRDTAGVEAEGASPEFNRNLKVATKQMARKVVERVLERGKDSKGRNEGRVGRLLGLQKGLIEWAGIDTMPA